MRYTMEKHITSISCYKQMSILFFATCLCAPLWAASERDELRIDIGLSIFPRVLAVDTQFQDKLTTQNQVRLAFVYSHDQKKANYLADLMLEKRSIIANAKVITEAVSIKELLKINPHKYAAIFVAEKLADEQMTVLVGISVTRSRILFSPFIGDVERGVTIGVMITSRVWPYLNMNTMKEAGINLNVLLVKYAKRYE